MLLAWNRALFYSIITLTLLPNAAFSQGLGWGLVDVKSGDWNDFGTITAASDRLRNTEKQVFRGVFEVRLRDNYREISKLSLGNFLFPIFSYFSVTFADVESDNTCSQCSVPAALSCSPHGVQVPVCTPCNIKLTNLRAATMTFWDIKRIIRFKWISDMRYMKV